MINSAEIQILINGIDFTTKISEFEVSGGVNDYKLIKCFNNSYKKTLVGKSAYDIKVSFLVDDTNIQDIFNDQTPITIDYKEITNKITFTYNNMIPNQIDYSCTTDNIMMATITFSAPPVDENGDDNRQVL